MALVNLGPLAAVRPPWNLTPGDFPRVFTMPTLKLPTWVQRYGSAHAMVTDARRQLHRSYGRHGRHVMARFMDSPIHSDLSVETLTGGRSVLLDALATETDPAARVVLLAALDAMNAGRPSTHVGATASQPESSTTTGPARMALPAETPPMVRCAHERRHLVTSSTEADAHQLHVTGATNRAHVRCGGFDT